jgi:hypothetical protein
MQGKPNSSHGNIAILPRQTAHSILKSFAERACGFVAEALRDSEVESLVFVILSPASRIRQQVRYSIGDAPTVSLNLSAKDDRDMPARCAKSSTVQSRLCVIKDITVRENRNFSFADLRLIAN